MVFYLVNSIGILLISLLIGATMGLFLPKSIGCGFTVTIYITASMITWSVSEHIARPQWGSGLLAFLVEVSLIPEALIGIMLSWWAYDRISDY